MAHYNWSKLLLEFPMTAMEPMASYRQTNSQMCFSLEPIRLLKSCLKCPRLNRPWIDLQRIRATKRDTSAEPSWFFMKMPECNPIGLSNVSSLYQT